MISATGTSNFLRKHLLQEMQQHHSAFLGHVLDTLFRLLHPVMPFITETMWTTLTGGETLVTAAWPVADPSHINKKSEALVGELQKIITEVRRFRNDQGVKAITEDSWPHHRPCRCDCIFRRNGISAQART